METSLKDTIASINLAAEPDLVQALKSIFCAPDELDAAKKDYDDKQNAYKGLKSKLDKLEERRAYNIASYGQQNETNIDTLLEKVSTDCKRAKNERDEVIVKRQNVNTALVEEWSAWARKVAQEFLALCDHPACTFAQDREFKRIHTFFTTTADAIEKICRDLKNGMERYRITTSRKREDAQQILSSFKSDATREIVDYRQGRKNIKAELEKLMTFAAPPTKASKTHRRRHRM